MLEKIFWFGVGYLVARYIILGTPDYVKKEAEITDNIREKVHELVKKYAPDASDLEVGNDVLNVLPVK